VKNRKNETQRVPRTQGSRGGEKQIPRFARDDGFDGSNTNGPRENAAKRDRIKAQAARVVEDSRVARRKCENGWGLRRDFRLAAVRDEIPMPCCGCRTLGERALLNLSCCYTEDDGRSDDDRDKICGGPKGVRA
jgi:hypothetical protein